MTKKQILLRGLGATLALALLGILVNGVTFLAQDKAAETVAFAIEAPEEEPTPDSGSVGGDSLRPLPPRQQPGQMTAPDFVRELTKDRVRKMSRSEAVHRVDELGYKREQSGLTEIEQLELDMLLEKHFPPAVGEPIKSVPSEPGVKGVGLFSGQLDVNNVFNKVWGLLQGLILAWVGFMLNDRRKK